MSKQKRADELRLLFVLDSCDEASESDNEVPLLYPPKATAATSNAARDDDKVNVEPAISDKTKALEEEQTQLYEKTTENALSKHYGDELETDRKLRNQEALVTELRSVTAEEKKFNENNELLSTKSEVSKLIANKAAADIDTEDADADCFETADESVVDNETNIKNYQTVSDSHNEPAKTSDNTENENANSDFMLDHFKQLLLQVMQNQQAKQEGYATDTTTDEELEHEQLRQVKRQKLMQNADSKISSKINFLHDEDDTSSDYEETDEEDYLQRIAIVKHNALNTPTSASDSDSEIIETNFNEYMAVMLQMQKRKQSQLARKDENADDSTTDEEDSVSKVVIEVKMSQRAAQNCKNKAEDLNFACSSSKDLVGTKDQDVEAIQYAGFMESPTKLADNKYKTELDMSSDSDSETLRPQICQSVKTMRAQNDSITLAKTKVLTDEEEQENYYRIQEAAAIERAYQFYLQLTAESDASSQYLAARSGSDSNRSLNTTFVKKTEIAKHKTSIDNGSLRETAKAAAASSHSMPKRICNRCLQKQKNLYELALSKRDSAAKVATNHDINASKTKLSQSTQTTCHYNADCRVKSSCDIATQTKQSFAVADFMVDAKKHTRHARKLTNHTNQSSHKMPNDRSTARAKPQPRMNYSFSNERTREIDRQNKILLAKLMRPKSTIRPKEKIRTNVVRENLATINRRMKQTQIDKENRGIMRRIQAISKRQPLH